MDVLKKAAESRRKAQLNSIDEADGGPQPPLHEERPVRIIFIATTGADAGQARQLPWVMHGGNTPNKTWLAILRYYTLQELGKASCRYLEEGDHPRQFVGILRDIKGMNVTPNAADQIELIDDDHINAWLRLSRCTTHTIAYFVYRGLFPAANSGDAVRPNTPLGVGNRDYHDHGQFDVAEFYTEPDSDSDVDDDAVRRGKRRKAFPRSHAGWQKSILSNDCRVVRLQDHSRELISRALIKQGPTYMRLYAGQDVQNLALRTGVPPSGYEAPLYGGGDGDGDGDGDRDGDGNGGN
ncbi:hypothetical protein HOY82DRAFT_606577 [Tuber indicum]|nr:hypothetical protein HOY82DRAFT_606577 [Tuber indicum]